MALHNDVFKQQIWNFFCDDLESCLTVSKLKQVGNNTFKGGLNFTALLVIFSVIDFASGFFAGRKPSTEDVARFLARYAGNYWDRLKDTKFSKKFYGVFRNGLSHQWSPKASGVAMDFQNVEVMLLMPYRDEEIPFLNVPRFYGVIHKALTEFERDIDKDPMLQINFKKRYDLIVENDFKEMRIFRDMFRL